MLTWTIIAAVFALAIWIDISAGKRKESRQREIAVDVAWHNEMVKNNIARMERSGEL